MTDTLTPADRIRQDAAAWLNRVPERADAAWLSDTPCAWIVIRPPLDGALWTIRRNGPTLRVTAGPLELRWTPAYPLPDDPADLIRLALALLAYGEPSDTDRLRWR